MGTVEQITPTAVRILEALGRYQYLTTAQMHRAGASSSMRHLYDTLRDLRRARRPSVKGLDFGVTPITGRLPVLYYLTKHGVKILEECGADPEQIRFPKNAQIAGTDYLHRVQTVDLHMAAQQGVAQSGGVLNWCVTYFDSHRKPGARFAPPTLIEFDGVRFNPDAVFHFTGADHTDRLCYCELHRGKDIKRLIKQVQVYADAIEAAALERTFNYPAAARVLLVLDDRGTLPGTVERLKDLAMPAYVAERFFIKTHEGVMTDFKNQWTRLTIRLPGPLF